MIANNENGRALQGSAPTVASERASAPNAAEKANYPRPLGATPLDVTWEVTMLVAPGDFDRLICPCNDGPSPCPECRREIDATLARIRSAQGLDEDEGGYFVDSREGEARDEPEDVS